MTEAQMNEYIETNRQIAVRMYEQGLTHGYWKAIEALKSKQSPTALELAGWLYNEQERILESDQT